MLFTFIPFSIFGIILSKHWKLSGLIAWVLGLYSVLGHQESRSDFTNMKRKRSPSNHAKWFSKSQLAIFFLLATNLPMAFYMSMVHQRGAEDVMNSLKRSCYWESEKCSFPDTLPCYSYANCSPSEMKGIPDESNQFMMKPAGSASKIAKKWSLPSHIILFDSQEKLLKDFLVLHSFQEVCSMLFLSCTLNAKTADKFVAKVFFCLWVMFDRGEGSRSFKGGRRSPSISCFVYF